MALIKLRNIDRFAFIVRNKTDCYRAFKKGVGHRDYKSAEGMKLIEKARKELKYSPRTYSGDIYVILWKMYKEICVE